MAEAQNTKIDFENILGFRKISKNKYYERREPTQKKYRCEHTKNYMVQQQPMSTSDNKEISPTNLV